MSSVPAAASRRVALVTGAAQRIGREIALELARAGHDIALHWRRSREAAEATAVELRALGVQADLFEADLADEAACRALLPAVLQRFGRVDVVVNNASLFEYDDAAGFSYASMEHHARVNTAAAVVLAQMLHAQLEANGGAGCVVNLLDQKLTNLNPDYFSYTLSKAALQAATVMLAQALAPHVRVVGVAPGVTLTSDRLTPEQFAQAHRLTPLHRSSTPQDVARTVRFIVESPAITGTTLLVDGGQHLLGLQRDVLFLVQGE